MSLLILGIILFLGIHLIRVVIPDFRRSMIASLGESGWRIGYSIVSILTLILLIYGFGQARDSTPIWSPPFWMSHITILLMLFALICLVASLLPAGYIAVRTKHPMVLSVKIWAFAHLLSNGDGAAMLLFAAFLAWGVIVRISLKRRERAGEISLRPFVSAKYDLYAIIIGIVVWGLIIWKLHEWIIGVSPLVM
ncbi:NnrU family protein [Rhizobium leucaenae]|uniref:Putative membrane protein n=1 Tax=Rhizobium leucaenae TaxID=29450 RepID=A0A7W6ZNY9_9HYPH|nr:NnrU family protein [Rhizobium leucaenae]MBB4566062.1 putative membrane protein [Rhizobium leucaenae]MBB6302311.1 putative membrane protein [Rhizobium leucaenae]